MCDLVFNENRKITKDDIIPNMTKIIFRWYYDHKIEPNILSDTSLMNITFGYSYNQKIKRDVLPHKLEELIFGYCYNKKIKEHILPPNLKCLVFGKSYNQEIDINVLPCNLKCLVIGVDFCQSFIINGKSILPNSLHEIYFNNRYIPFDHKALTTINKYIKVYLFKSWIKITSQQIKKEYENITSYIDILRMIDDILPLPIAEEITPNIFEEFPNIL